MTDATAPLDALSADAGPVARGSVARVAIATAVSAVCGYAVLYLAARRLDPAGFSVFGVFWGAFGLVTGAANGLLQEATREVRSTRHRGVPEGPRTAPMRVAAGVGAVAAAAIAVSAPLWSGQVFASSRTLSVVLLSAGLAGFCLHATLLGMLAGAGRWTQYGSLMVTDAGDHRQRRQQRPQPAAAVVDEVGDQVALHGGQRNQQRSAGQRHRQDHHTAGGPQFARGGLQQHRETHHQDRARTRRRDRV